MFFSKATSEFIIAYQFRVYPSTVSRNFHRVLDVAAAKAAALIKWPERDVLRQTMPTIFQKNLRNVVSLLTTEIFIERPTGLLARAQVWSNYKHHSTVNLLIGITPQGTISFLSKCVGGRMSDKEITKESGLLTAPASRYLLHFVCTNVIVLL